MNPNQNARLMWQIQELLEQVEWVRDSEFNIHFCPSCYSEQDNGHAADCKLAALLNDVKHNHEV